MSKESDKYNRDARALRSAFGKPSAREIMQARHELAKDAHAELIAERDAAEAVPGE